MCCTRTNLVTWVGITYKHTVENIFKKLQNVKISFLYKLRMFEKKYRENIVLETSVNAPLYHGRCNIYLFIVLFIFYLYIYLLYITFFQSTYFSFVLLYVICRRIHCDDALHCALRSKFVIKSNGIKLQN